MQLSLSGRSQEPSTTAQHLMVMASKQILLLLAAAVAFLPALAAATEHSVGDDNGWGLGFNYTAWAETKQFEVGDTLVFKYDEPSHTVVEVSGADFAACSTPEAATVMGTGRDRVAIDGPGRRWFVCGVGAHCLNGMKVRIDVPVAETAHVRGRSLAKRPKIRPISPAPKVQARLAQAVLAAVAAVLVL